MVPVAAEAASGSAHAIAIDGQRRSRNRARAQGQRIDLIERYCRKDVEVTRRLWELGQKQGFLLHRDKAGRTLRLPAAWS